MMLFVRSRRLTPGHVRLLIAVIGMTLMTRLAAAPGAVSAWTSSLNLSNRMTLSRLDWSAEASADAVDAHAIEVRSSERFQKMVGFGSSLEHTTCSNLFRLDGKSRAAALALLVNPEQGIGMNLMRLCMGTSDFAGEAWYSYDDLPPGQTDPNLDRFSIDHDKLYVIPCIKLAMTLNPKLSFFASPWSPPGWMKTTGSMIGGQLKPECRAAYADYFVKFIQAYQREGIPIQAVTVQNEPGVDRALSPDPKWHYPSCRWTGEQERDFIRDYLGPAIRRAGLRTKIWCYDHNYNLEAKADSPGLKYPRAILNDSRAAAFVDAVGFHHYEGEPAGMSRFREEFPKVTMRLTEGSVFGIWGASDLMERLRHGVVSYNAWVSILDDHGRPNNGPFPATHAILKLRSDTLRIEPLFEYYSYGHFMKFIQPGAVLIGSSAAAKELNHIAFKNPDGSIVLVVVNTRKTPSKLTIREGKRALDSAIGPETVITFRW